MLVAQDKQRAQTTKGEREILTAKTTSASLAAAATLSLITAVTGKALLIVGVKLNFVAPSLDTAAWELGSYDGSTFTAQVESVYSWEAPHALCLVPAGSSFRLNNTGPDTVTNVSATVLYCEV